eukprot:2419362-Rhodomonas_salina.1
MGYAHPHIGYVLLTSAVLSGSGFGFRVQGAGFRTLCRMSASLFGLVASHSALNLHTYQHRRYLLALKPARGFELRSLRTCHPSY